MFSEISKEDHVSQWWRIDTLCHCCFLFHNHPCAYFVDSSSPRWPKKLFIVLPLLQVCLNNFYDPKDALIRFLSFRYSTQKRRLSSDAQNLQWTDWQDSRNGWLDVVEGVKFLVFPIRFFEFREHVLRWEVQATGLLMYDILDVDYKTNLIFSNMKQKKLIKVNLHWEKIIMCICCTFFSFLAKNFSVPICIL